MQTVLYIIIIIVVLMFGFWAILSTNYRNEEKRRQYELKRESQKIISPIRLRAYERLTLLLERTKPEHMLMDLQHKDPAALHSWSIPQLQQYLLQTVRIEFDHNQSQQVYVSDELWDEILHAREQMAAFIIGIATQLPPNATTETYAKTMITAFTSNGETPTDKALEDLKNEAKELM